MRYWDRVGMYVTRDFAEDWAEKLKAGGDGTRGKYLDTDTEDLMKRFNYLRILKPF